MGAAEVVEPESRVELSGVILDQGELRPAHRAVDPGRGRRGGGAANLLGQGEQRTDMLHVFKNTLRERSFFMRCTTPRDSGPLAMTHRPAGSGTMIAANPGSPRPPDDGLSLLRPQ